MTTLKKLTLNKGFIQKMDKRGFQLYNEFSFVKKVNEFYYIIDPELLSSGDSLRVRVFVWLPEVEDHLPQGVFPKFPSFLTGGCFSSYTVDRSSYWNVSNDENIRSSLIDIIACVDRIAIPWFSCVQTKGDFIETITPHIKSLPLYSTIISRLEKVMVPPPDLGIVESSLPGGNRFLRQDDFWQKADLLISEMEDLGFIFEPSPRCRFYKICDDIYRFIVPEFYSNGAFLAIRTFVWVPEVDENPIFEIPEEVTTYTGGLLGHESVGEVDSWFIGNESKLMQAIRDAGVRIRQIALPWFETIRTREDFVKAIHPGLKPDYDVETSLYGKLVKRILTPGLHYRSSEFRQHMTSYLQPKLEERTFKFHPSWSFVYDKDGLQLFLVLEVNSSVEGVSVEWSAMQDNQFGYLHPGGVSEESYFWSYDKTSSLFDMVLQHVDRYFLERKRA